MKISFFKSVAKLSTFSIVAQISSVIALPLITRMFTPAEFGLYSFFVTIVTVIGLVASGQYHKVIMVTDDPLEADNLVFLAFFLAVVFAAMTFLSIEIATAFDLFPNDRDILMSLSGSLFLALFLYTSNQALYLWNNRYKNYNLMGGSSLARDLVSSLGKLAFGYFGILKLGLVYGFLISQVAFFLLLFFPFLRERNYKIQPLQFYIKNSLALVKKYIQFPKLSLPADFLGTFSIQAPILFMAPLFGATILGYYALARSLLGIPIAVLGASIGAVFQRDASEKFNKSGNCEQLYCQTGGVLFALGIIPVILLMFFAEPLFVFAFGTEWTTAGYYCAILSPLYLMRLIGKPLCFVFVLTNHLKFDFYLMTTFAVASILSLGMGFYLQSAEIAVYLISITHSLSYAVYIYFGYRMSTGKMFGTH